MKPHHPLVGVQVRKHQSSEQIPTSVRTSPLPNNEKQAVGQSTVNKGPRRPRVTKHQLEAWYRTYILELILRQKPLRPSKNGRCIPLGLGHDSALIDERRGHAYISNTIRTSRYTLWDFIPKQLIFQFTRLSNFYFLCIGVPQTIPGLSTTGTYTTILPLLFFVLLMIAKEGYDDYRRHRLDKVENARPTTVLRKVADRSGGTVRSAWSWFGLGGARTLPGLTAEEQGEAVNGYRWTQVHWRDVKVGDIVKLARDDDVPADMVLLHATGEHGLAYIETMAIDGETNLKSRQVSVALPDCSTLETIDACKAEFVLEDPNPELYRFDGRVTAGDKTPLPITLNEIIYRGSILRNTKCALGMVINTGEECKIRMNANRHPKAKKPALEKVANRIVMSLIIYVILLTAGCSIGYLLWQRSTERVSFYLVDAAVKWQEIIIGFAIQFNNLIALAMYVSLEIVRLGQMFMLNSDVGMYDEATDTPARCNTNTILENLGQIGYVFSDKTGTLTENVMKFKKLSIAGTAWLHETDLQGEGMAPARQMADAGFPFDADTSPAGPGGAIPEDAELDVMSPGTLASPTPLSPRRASSQWRSAGRPDREMPDLTTVDLLEYIQLRPESQIAKTALEYILALALCHTCLPEIKEDGQVEFQAASPDELALVKAAQELGFLVVQRSTHRTTVRINLDRTAGVARDEEYEILDVIEFSSKRKRMSVIVRCPDGRIWLICKGADSMLLPRLKMAHLALQKANEVRESAEMDREMRRKSEQREPRGSIGARASLTMRRSLTREKSGSAVRPSAMRSQSFEASKLRKSGDYWRPTPSRAFSFDVSKQSSGNMVQPPLPDRLALLDDGVPQDEGEVFTRCFQHLDEFAAEGLRTLLFAHRFIPEADYTSWKKLFLDATTSLTDRQEQIEAVGEMIEQNFVLLGATAIEDKLQKGVPETIEKLRRANIKIWMLTGDKRETAINIAHSARICKPASEIFILDSTKGDLEKQISSIIEDLQLREDGSLDMDMASPHTVVVIDGHTLSCIEALPPLQRLFYALIPTIDSVICCRASPAQKALLVRTIRHAPRSPLFSRQRRHPGLTLAIGDGANDLAMLAEAHVGIGISGREGLQAARVADYAIAQFRFLSRLLLLHGRWNYVRTARFILATFWKEMFFYTGTIAYQRFNGYTGTSLYEMWSLTVLNTLFTSLCVIIPGVWEKDLGEATLLAVPELYVHGQRGRELYAGRYIGWMLGGAAEGVIMYFGCWAGYHVFGQPSDPGLFAFGDLVFSVAMMWTNIKLMLIETHHKTPIVLGCFVLSIAGWWIWQCVLAGVYAQSPSPYAVTKGFFKGFGRDAAWWLTCIVVLSVLVVVELVWKALERSRPARAVRRVVRRGLRLWSKKGKRAGAGASSSMAGAAVAAAAAGAVVATTAAEADGRGTDTALAAAEDEWDPALWQVLEQDPLVRQRLELINEAEEMGLDDGEVDDVLEGRGAV